MQTMQFSEAVVLAFHSIRAHKLRSFLTLLGVIVGVMAVVVVASFIESVNQSVMSTVTDDLGANTVILDKYGIINGLDEWIAAQKRNKDITMDDYRALEAGVTLAQKIGIQLNAGVEALRVGNRELLGTQINGDTANMVEITPSGTTIDAGRFLTEADVENRRNVAVIGNKLKTELFPTVDPIGRELRVNGQVFEIIGVAKELGTFLGQDRDNFAIIPYTVHQKMFGVRQSLTIFFKAANPKGEEAVQDQVRTIMRGRRHLTFSEKDSFGFVSADAIKDLWNSLTGLIAVVALAVTSISLVVGGIVIMNIMMVAVTERTREIGIRKSLGARRKDILRQFLVESSMLSGFGGVIGILLTWGGIFIVSKALNMAVTMPIWSIVLSLSVSTLVGLVFGIYPAYRAASLDPITALRYE